MAVNEIEYTNELGGKEIISGNENPFTREIYVEKDFHAYFRVKGNNPGDFIFNIRLIIENDLGIDHSETGIVTSLTSAF